MIHPFTWHFDTEVHFGAGEEDHVGEYAKKWLGTRILLVRGGDSFLRQSHVLDRILASLEAAGIAWEELRGIQGNPLIGPVRQGIDLFRSFGATGLLAVGGGSVIDTAKAIAAGVHYEGDVWELYLGKGKIQTPPPVGVVVTMAAAGSEGSTGSVITNPETREKYDIMDDSLRPKFSVLDPEITLTTPPYQTACGVVDILAHVMERYFTDTPEVELVDRLSEAVMVTVVHNGLLLAREPDNTTARSQILWAATLAHNGLLEGGRNTCWASHAMGMELSAHYNTAHGATLSVIIPAWMAYTYTRDIPRFARFAREVMGVQPDEEHPERTAKEGIRELVRFYKQLSMPVTLGEIGGADPGLFETMAASATRHGPIGCIRKLNREDVAEIYRLALEEPKLS